MKAKRKRANPLAKWRFNAGTRARSVTIRHDGIVNVYPPDPSMRIGKTPIGDFDELVIGGGTDQPCPLHAKAMSDSSLSVSLGFALFSVWVRAGKVRVRLQEGVYEPKTGLIHPHGWTAPVRKKRGKR